ncbi:MAG TPA: sugar ABC transporter permease [Clostridiales bacterium]|nr:sugar ABC transporter permease [Clostridiales bacterium]
MYWLSKKRYIIGLTLPTIIIYSVYIIIPIFIAIYYSFTKYSGIGKPVFTGLKNYQRLFADGTFWISFRNTLIMFGVAFVLLMVVAFFGALLLNQHLKFNGLSKALIFSPAIIAPIIVGIIWVYILDPEVGILNDILGAIGLDAYKQQWIGGKSLSPYSIAIIYFWQQLGYLITIYIAGLKMIPGDVMEAAQIDGANERQKVRYITIPLMRNTISNVAVLIITGVFKIFEIVQQTTGGGPNHMSENLVTYSYSTTFKNGEYGYGMSIATLTFVVTLIITGIYLAFAKERRE